MKATFCKQDSCAAVKRKLTAAWPNLRLELHQDSIWLHKEGRDDFGGDTVFFPDETETAGDSLLVLTGKETKATAERLLSDFYSNRQKFGDNTTAFIFENDPDEGVFLEQSMSLGDCNQPFVLPLNKFSYAEFKRRFTERWKYLSVEIYQCQTARDSIEELTDEFEMRLLTRVNRLIRFDYHECDGKQIHVQKTVNEHACYDGKYLGELESSLKKVDVVMRVKNNRLRVYWSDDLKQARLRDFQEAASVEKPPEIKAPEPVKKARPRTAKKRAENYDAKN